MWCFTAGLSAVRNTEWAEKKIKTALHVSNMTCLYWVFAVIIYVMEQDQFKNNWGSYFCKNLRTNLGQNLLVLIKKKRVPHGTVLAPLLFLLFIDDIETKIDSQMRLFADDCLVHWVIPAHVWIPGRIDIFLFAIFHMKNKVVMNCKFKKNTICRVFGVLSSKHMFLLASLLTLGPVVWQFAVVVTVYKWNVGRCLYGRRSCSSLTWAYSQIR